MKGWSRLLVCLAALALSSSAGAQTLPAGPIEFADGHVTVAGDVSAGYGTDDTGAYFNYTDYDHSALRLLRVDIMAQAKANEHLALLAEIRTENVDTIEPYALYVRVRPWANHDFDIQAGRIPPTFGAFARRTYPSDNPLIGYPLAYQYLTSLRPDALPASADELLRKRGLGWADTFSIGSPDRVPLGHRGADSRRHRIGRGQRRDCRHLRHGLEPAGRRRQQRPPVGRPRRVPARRRPHRRQFARVGRLGDQ